MVAQWWHNIGTIVAQWWHNGGRPMLAQWWHNGGRPMLAQCWHNGGQPMLAQYWHNGGTMVAQWWPAKCQECMVGPEFKPAVPEEVPCTCSPSSPCPLQQFCALSGRCTHAHVRCALQSSQLSWLPVMACFPSSQVEASSVRVTYALFVRPTIQGMLNDPFTFSGRASVCIKNALRVTGFGQVQRASVCPSHTRPL